MVVPRDWRPGLAAGITVTDRGARLPGIQAVVASTRPEQAEAADVAQLRAVGRLPVFDLPVGEVDPAAEAAFSRAFIATATGRRAAGGVA